MTKKYSANRIPEEVRVFLLLAGCWALVSVTQLSFNPYPALVNDAVAYFTVAADFANYGELSARQYYFQALVDGPFPQKDPHFPGYHLTLAAFFKLFGVSEDLGKIFNHVIFAASLVLFYLLTLRLTGGDTGISVLANLLFMTYPIVNKSIIMTEVTVIFSNLLCVYVIFNIFERKPNLVSSFILCISVIYAILVRPNAVFLIPGVLIIFQHRRYWPWLGVTAMLGLITTIAILYSGILADRQTPPNDFLTALAQTSGAADFMDLIANNFISNWNYFLIADLANWHGFSVMLLIAMFAAGCVGRSLQTSPQKNFVRFVLLYFIINSVAIFALYDTQDWRFLRSALQFVPLLILVVVLKSRQHLSEKWSKTTIACLTLCFVGISPSFHSQFEQWQELEQKQARIYRSHYSEIMPDRVEPYFVVSNVPYPRFVIDYPTSYVAVLRNIGALDKSLSKILEVYPASDIVLTGFVPPATEASLGDLGFLPIHEQGELSFYRKISG